MANLKLTALPVLTAVSNGTLLYVVDPSDHTDDPTGSSKQMAVSVLLADVPRLDQANTFTEFQTVRAPGNQVALLTLVATGGGTSSTPLFTAYNADDTLAFQIDDTGGIYASGLCNVNSLQVNDGSFTVDAAGNIANSAFSASANGNVSAAAVTFRTKAGDPTTSDVPAGFWMVWKNTSTGAVKLWANDGGTLKSVALA